MEAKLQQQTPQKAQTNKPNLTGIPTQMKLDFERRSGLSFDDVRVHYNSDKPAQLQALAYTQGTQVYVGPGQEQHLPHELGHVVQQKNGLVHPTKITNGVAINDSPALEKMADYVSLSTTYHHLRSTFARNTIQCKAKVGVTLTPDFHNLYLLNDVFIDTITFSDRFDTDFQTKSSTGKFTKLNTQGDHTIADSLIKKYQKTALKGKSVADAALFYKRHLSEIRTDIQAPKHAGPGDRKRFRIARTYMNIANSYVDKIENNRNNYIPLPMQEINVLVERLIFNYNSAYSRSPYSTVVSSSGHPTGKGEGTGLKQLNILKWWLWGKDELSDKVEKLIDTSLLDRLYDSNAAITAEKYGGMEKLSYEEIEKVIDLISFYSDRHVVYDYLFVLKGKLQPGKSAVVNRTFGRYIKMLIEIIDSDNVYHSNRKNLRDKYKSTYGY